MRGGHNKGCPHITDEQYFAKMLSKCLTAASGCFLWQGTRNWKGYGYMFYRGRTIGVHRIAYMLKKGAIPKGMQVCHTCDTRNCCNPDHLWLGSNADNHKDKDAKGRNYFTNLTHCKRGHEFTPGSYVVRKYRRKTMRVCLACEKWRQAQPEYKAKTLERQRRKRAEKRAAAQAAGAM